MTLKVARRPRLAATAARAAMMCTVVVCAGLALAGSAFADHAYSSEPPTLNGGWAPFNRCPVDNPAMLAIEGTTTEAFCIDGNTPNGSMTTGNLTVAFGRSDHQYGVIQNREGALSPTVSPPGGDLVVEPAKLPGGLEELMCPGATRVARRVCAMLQHSHHGWGDDRFNEVTWTLESAGALTNFSLFAGLQPGAPVATVRVKIHLQNQLLGNNCYIGSEAEPIVFEPSSITAPAVEFLGFSTNGALEPPEPMTDIKSVGAQSANSFTVPVANGCGWRGILDRAVDGKVGLPSSASTNNITFNENTTNLVGLSNPENAAPNEGKVFAEYWHSAVLSTGREGHHGDGHWDGRHWSRGETEEGMWSRFRLRHRP